jgi:cephalosporin hydroxylase
MEQESLQMKLQYIKNLFDQKITKPTPNYYSDKRLSKEFIEKYGKPDVFVDQLNNELESLLIYYIDRKPLVTLEIGTYQGGTLWYWVKYAPENATVISLDIDHSICRCWDELYSIRPDVNLVKLSGDSKDPKIIEEAFNIASQFDFCFIDGDHSYKSVKNDWEVYGKKSKITAFHDIACGTSLDDPEPVRKLWNEITPLYENKYISLIEGAEPSNLCYGIGVIEP